MELLYLLLASLALNGFFFVFAAVLRTDVFTDITYSLTYFLLSVLLFVFARPDGLITTLVLSLVCLWAIRLGSYLLRRILIIKVDHRFDDRRDNPIAFGSFWLLQAITVWVVMIPVASMAFADGRGQGANPYVAYPFLALALASLAFETVADAQKFAFKRIPGNDRAFMKRGLWSLSRHPNYFGELLFWWSLALSGVTVFRGLEWLSFIGPVFITVLIRYVSGVPLLEKSAEKKWGSDPDYVAYRDSTSLIIPRIAKKGAR